MNLRVSGSAETDLTEIALYIASDNPPAAKRWLADIRRRFDTLAEFPGIGTSRDDVRPGLRMFPVGTYLILYNLEDDTLEVVRVVHGARQWERLLSQ